MSIEIRTDDGFLIFGVDGIIDGIIFNGDYRLKDHNLLSFLYKILSTDFIKELKGNSKSSEFKKLVEIISIKRKDVDEYFNFMNDILFNGYVEHFNHYDILEDINAPKHLKINLDDFRSDYPTIQEYIELYKDVYMTYYETFHDQIITSVQKCIALYIEIGDIQYEIWEDYDSGKEINWNKLEADSIEKYKNKEVFIYGIRKIRKLFAKHVGITTTQFRQYKPLKHVYERKYYTPTKWGRDVPDRLQQND